MGRRRWLGAGASRSALGVRRGARQWDGLRIGLESLPILLDLRPAGARRAARGGVESAADARPGESRHSGGVADSCSGPRARRAARGGVESAADARPGESYHSRGMADPCDVCGAAGGMRPLLEAGLHGVGAVWIRQCAGCGFRQVRPRLPPAALDALYGADYFDSASAHGFAGYARQRQRYERDAYFLARELRRIAPAGRFLEVGSALGFLLAALDPLTGWEVEGVEVSRFGAWYARDRFGAAVHRGTLEEAGLPSDAFDYVLQKDLLEHVTHPRRHLEETRRIMRRGGRLRVVTPNGEADLRPLCRTAAARESDELPLLGQGHLSFFSRRSCSACSRASGSGCCVCGPSGYAGACGRWGWCRGGAVERCRCAGRRWRCGVGSLTAGRGLWCAGRRSCRAIGPLAARQGLFRRRGGSRPPGSMRRSPRITGGFAAGGCTSTTAVSRNGSTFCRARGRWARTSTSSSRSAESVDARWRRSRIEGAGTRVEPPDYRARTRLSPLSTRAISLGGICPTRRER